ncbi:MAG: tripartite tricarboxylate transporter substrate binding protein [Planctomycetes bacterium]|nr:tripartite tricarboxylate transporter substrate binding protein [Planctomycetota bacterium]
MKRFFPLLPAVISFVICLLFSAFTHAAEYPEREIRIIVAFAPGGQTDLISRKLGEIIQSKQIMRPSLLTVNLPGGNTADAVNATRRARPDGYTFFLHHTNLITNNVMGNLTTKYSEFDLVGGLVEQPFGIVARSDDNRWKDASEFVAAAKANPGTLSVCFPGFASPGHFALLQLLAAFGGLGSVKEVPYTGGAAAISAHLGGHTDLRSTNMGDSARYVTSGEIKFLGMISSKRNPDFPDVPCLKDMGSNAEGLILRTGFFAPKGIPEDVKTKFMQIIRAAAESPEFAEFSRFMSNTVVLSSAEEFHKAYDEDFKTISELAKGLTKQ